MKELLKELEALARKWRGIHESAQSHDVRERTQAFEGAAVELEGVIARYDDEA